MSLVKHSKLKNTGILFELLTRQITSEVLSKGNSKAVNILKKFFTKTELGKEYKLYESLFKNRNLNESKANTILDSILEFSRKIDVEKLSKEKYNLVKEIKNHYNLDDFFKTKLSNYRQYAAFHILLELNRNKNSNFTTKQINQIVENKTTILEHLTTNTQLNVKDSILGDFNTYDRDLRILTYKLLLEKFNEKYSSLNSSQKTILKEFINLKDSPHSLKNFYNSHIKNIKTHLKELNSKTKDKATKIKIDSVVMMLNELDKKDKITTSHLVNLMQYNELYNELKEVNE